MIGWARGARSVNSSRWLLVIAAIVTLLVVAIFVIGERSRSFVRFTAAGSFTVDGEYPSTNRSVIHGIRYGSWSGDDRNTGTLTSEPFTAPNRIAFMIAGYPNHRGEQHELVRVDNARTRIDVGVAAAPKEHWQPRFFIVPPSWQGQQVRFVATDAGRAWGDWIGIADVRPADNNGTILETIDALAEDIGVRLLGLTLVASLLIFPVIGAGTAICRRLNLPTLLVYAMSCLVLGAAAEFTFFMTMVNRHVASALVIVGAVGGTWLTVRMLRAHVTSRHVTSRQRHGRRLGSICADCVH